MATKEEIEIAIRVVDEFAGSPDSGVVAELIRRMKESSTPAKEVRVVEAKETR